MLELDFVRLVMFLRWLESAVLDLGDEMHKFYARICSVSIGFGCSWHAILILSLVNVVSVASTGDLGLRLLWHIIHLFVSIWYFIVGLMNTLENFLISSGLFKRYRDLDISKVKYLAVVIDSEEALQTLNVLQLLRWLAAIGLRNVCLYDKEGVLKISQEALRLWLKSERIYKAANVLLKKYYLNGNTEKSNLTESDMADALAEIGHGGAEPDLMLIYGPARCHLGFPAWRIRYTEMVHMGPLKSMKFGALMKAIRRYMKRYASSGNSCKPPIQE
ncbi:hypothetical protein Sango_0896400 [Sesamum angolense]|uniref:ditrans,polycis-polyprenyl diphosphate synthase [(2E,6E)-farnesyldiphosphate specific] n=1 Tax=Sesamum angolense TaxID=2727404 RepID=A0AAE1WXP5_9LAMI|nr:hypothetical protein Sango_0896400 [Sesamum angolense]